MGNHSSKGNSNGLFSKELEHAFNYIHSYKDPYVPLILIQAHSIEPDKDTFELPEEVHLFHFCKKGCILRTSQLKTNTNYRSVSMEYACLKQLDIYDTYEKKCPNYEFFIDEDTKEEGGVYICLDKEIRKLFTFEPGINYSMIKVIPFIQDFVNGKNVQIGILSCRTTNACSNVVHALPGSPSKHENKVNLNKIHSPHKRTLNTEGYESRSSVPKRFKILTRKSKSKKSKR